MGLMTFRRASEADMDQIMALVTETFSGEQRIPLELIPIPEELSPQWWCAEIDGKIIGSIALYKDHNEWHMGRFAVSPENRGCHLGTMLLQSAVREIFSSGIEEIYCEARDTTVHIVEKLGGKITGDPVPFYDGNVTPMILKRIYYFDDSVDKR